MSLSVARSGRPPGTTSSSIFVRISPHQQDAVGLRQPPRVLRRIVVIELEFFAEVVANQSGIRLLACVTLVVDEIDAWLVTGLRYGAAGWLEHGEHFFLELCRQCRGAQIDLRRRFDLLEMRTETELIGTCPAHLRRAPHHPRLAQPFGGAGQAVGCIVVVLADQEYRHRRVAKLVGDIHIAIGQHSIALRRQFGEHGRVRRLRLGGRMRQVQEHWRAVIAHALQEIHELAHDHGKALLELGTSSTYVPVAAKNGMSVRPGNSDQCSLP